MPILHHGLGHDPVLGGLAQTTRFVVQSTGRRRVPSSLISEAIGPEFANWFYFTGIRQSPTMQQPVCVTELFLHRRAAAASSLVGQEFTLIYQLVERACGERMRRGRVQLIPCRLNRRQAASVAAPAGALGIQIVRRLYNQDDELLEVTNTVCPADRIGIEIGYDLPSSDGG